jgi:hypothetical protein
MGQYYLVVNLDKKEFIHPHKFNDGLKLMEFGTSGTGTMAALALLLSNGNGQGCGDCDSEHPSIGSWAGDRIVVAGDYGNPHKFFPETTTEELQEVANKSFTEGHQNPEAVTLYHLAKHSFKDISVDIMAAMLEDAYLADNLEPVLNQHTFQPFKETIIAAKKKQKEKIAECFTTQVIEYPKQKEKIAECFTTLVIEYPE